MTPLERQTNVGEKWNFKWNRVYSKRERVRHTVREWVEEPFRVLNSQDVNSRKQRKAFVKSKEFQGSRALKVQPPIPILFWPFHPFLYLLISLQSPLDFSAKDPENLQPKFAINYYRSIIFGFLPDPNESRDPVQENSTGKGNYAPCPWMFQSFRDRYFVPKSTQNPTRTIP